ncbi:cobalamin biosynthesis protein CobW [Staphylococcus succinus]|nr:cobalamin biosynthesis protein CobW [Staphylococcus succinus]
MTNKEDSRISITVITGFLGSGKTTFLSNYVKYLLSNNEKPSIIVNEYGNLNIDSSTLSDDVKVASILNGCVCCDLQLDLIKQLKHFLKESAMQHIIIEATGIAHPIEIIAACQDPEIVENVNPPVIIGLVDAPRFLARNNYSNNTKLLMEEQLSVSDTIIINKMDLIDASEREALNGISDINAYAPKVYTTYAEVDMNKLLSVTPKASKDMSNHVHHHGMNSMQYRFTGPIDRQLFYQFILRLPDNVLRLKGYVKFRDMPNDIYEFQYAHGLPDYQIIEETLPLNIVLIGEEMDVNRLRNELEMLQFT